MWMYLIFFVLGAGAAYPCTTAQINNALEISGVLMLVALFASLLVPFSAFSEKEQGRKFLLQNLPLVAFGAYAMAVVHDFSVVKAVLVPVTAAWPAVTATVPLNAVSAGGRQKQKIGISHRRYHGCSAGARNTATAMTPSR